MTNSKANFYMLHEEQWTTSLMHPVGCNNECRGGCGDSKDKL